MHRHLMTVLIALGLAACTDEVPPRSVDEDMSVTPDGATDAITGMNGEAGMPIDEDGGSGGPDASGEDPDASQDPDDGVEPDGGDEADAAGEDPDAEAPDPDMAIPDMALPDACVEDCDGDDYTVEEGDCNDEDPAILPGAAELCDGVDNDCDESTDEGLVQQCYDAADDTLQVGLCRAGASTCVDGAFGACEGQVLPAVEACDGVADEDCDGAVDEGCDVDEDGVTVDAGDCDDDNPNAFPGADEVCDGADNDCDEVVDGIERPCYEGPPGTLGEGACLGGTQVCAAGDFGACQGQVLPSEEACDDGVDDDCDGVADEGCDNPECPDVDLNAPVEVTIGCVTAGSNAVSIITATVRAPGGAPIPDADVRIDGPPGAVVGGLLNEGTLYYRAVTAPADAGEQTFTASVGCGDGSRIALNTRATLTVAPTPPAANALLTGGCSPLDGNVFVRVLDAERGTPIEDAWVQVGGTPINELQPGAQAAIRGQAGNGSSVVRTGANGGATIRDLGGTLAGPQTLTASADGYENLSLIGFDGSFAVLPLRPLDPPPVETAVVSGTLNDFDDLARDGQADFGLVLPSFDLSFLSTLVINQLLDRYECWDPVTEGVAGNLVGETAVPGNLYAPQQPEVLFNFPVNIDQHRFTLSDVPVGRPDQVMALAGKVAVDGIVGAINGGGLADIIALLVPGEIGVLSDYAVQGDVNDAALPLAVGLADNAGCDVSGLPANAGVLCLSVGDWDGAAGLGRLFPMGLASADPAVVDGAPGRAVGLDLTTVARDGVFRNVDYLGVGLGLYLDGDRAPNGQRNAVTAVFDRETLSPAGGRMALSGFYGTTGLARADFDFSWDPVANPESPAVDVCKVEVYRAVRDVYNPGACSDNLAAVTEYPMWTAYVAGDPGELTLPRLPGQWPRGATAGFIDVRDTPANDLLQMRIACYGLGAVEAFEFNAADFRDILRGLTHVSSNNAGF